MDEEKKIEFIASLPTSSNAISLKGDGSAKIILELSASELEKILPLATLGETTFKVIIEP